MLKSLDGVKGIETRVFEVTEADAIIAMAYELPNLDGLFNCVGVVHHGTVPELNDWDCDVTVSIDVTSMVRVCHTFIPGMLRRAQSTGSVPVLNMAVMASFEKRLC